MKKKHKDNNAEAQPLATAVKAAEQAACIDTPTGQAQRGDGPAFPTISPDHPAYEGLMIIKRTMDQVMCELETETNPMVRDLLYNRWLRYWGAYRGTLKVLGILTPKVARKGLADRYPIGAGPTTTTSTAPEQRSTVLSMIKSGNDKNKVKAKG